MESGVLITFDDGKYAIYPTSLLHEVSRKPKNNPILTPERNEQTRGLIVGTYVRSRQHPKATRSI